MVMLVQIPAKKACRVPYHKGGKKLHIGLMDAGESFINNTASTIDRFSSTLTFRSRSHAGAPEVSYNSRNRVYEIL